MLSADAVRAGSERLWRLAVDARLDDWSVDPARLSGTADFVAQVVRDRYPQLDVPLHSRWRHFVSNGVDLWRARAERTAWSSPDAAARAALDLCIVSVLLDAGAGPGWTFTDPASGVRYGRSEGLAIASLRWFESGGLSDHPNDPLRVDSTALRRVDTATLEAAFQAGPNNAVVGLAGRAALLNRLGTVLESRPELFRLCDAPRPGGLFDALRTRSVDGRLPAARILESLLDGLGGIWEGRPVLDELPLGDCWPHPALVGERPEDAYAPLHKLSQWLAYSLIEPLETGGVVVTDVQALTGLAEYRNGGLFIDCGVLRAREPSLMHRPHDVAGPFVVGWRSLTVALLDRLAPMVSARLGLDTQRFPLARVLEGGTWAAGRLIAQRLRADGGPPFQIMSDGTVF